MFTNAHYKERIVARMIAERAENVSDIEIERTLMPCVAGLGLVRMAKILRGMGELTDDDVRNELV